MYERAIGRFGVDIPRVVLDFQRYRNNPYADWLKVGWMLESKYYKRWIIIKFYKRYLVAKLFWGQNKRSVFIIMNSLIFPPDTLLMKN